MFYTGVSLDVTTQRTGIRMSSYYFDFIAKRKKLSPLELVWMILKNTINYKKYLKKKVSYNNKTYQFDTIYKN